MFKVLPWHGTHNLVKEIIFIFFFLLFKKTSLPWPVWLSGLSVNMQIRESLVQFPVWVAGHVPSEGCVRGNHISMFLSLPSPL